jgi:3,4-dihydroxy 2-butanone 4-phosphate synthase/GTP cyclohydrolase II
MSEASTAERAGQVNAAVAAMRRGHPVVVIDPADRPGCGELVIPAARVSDRAINLLLRVARGLPALALPAQRARQLGLDADMRSPQFVDAAGGIGSGLSAQDRARTVAVAADPRSRREHLRRRGHVLVLPARHGGVLAFAGRAEAAIDLARLAGRGAAALTCEILNKDGSEAAIGDLEALSFDQRLAHLKTGDLVVYRRRYDLGLTLAGESTVDTEWGRFALSAWLAQSDDTAHLALTHGDVATGAPVLVRVHSECLTGDAFRSLRCDCGQQLIESLRAIGDAGAGVILYLPQEGRGIGLLDKLRAYALQDRGLDTVDANLALRRPVDDRDYAAAAAVLRQLDVTSVRLLTNSPHKLASLAELGIDVVERVPLELTPNDHNRGYLATKRARMGHLLSGARTLA